MGRTETAKGRTEYSTQANRIFRSPPVKEPQRDKDTCLYTKKKKFAFLSIALCPRPDPNRVPSAYEANVLPLYYGGFVVETHFNQVFYMYAMYARAVLQSWPAAMYAPSQ